MADFEKDHVLVHYAGHEGTFFIGKNVEIQQNVCIDFSGSVVIEDNVVIALKAVIYTHDHNCRYADWRSRPAIYNPLIIKKNAYIGACSLILANCGYVGESAVIAAGSVVTHPVPDFTIVAGNPAKFVGMVVQ